MKCFNCKNLYNKILVVLVLKNTQINTLNKIIYYSTIKSIHTFTKLNIYKTNTIHNY